MATGVRVTQELVMTFLNEAGKEVDITLDYPNPALTSAQIQSFMDWVIQKNILDSSGGRLVAKQDIKIIDSTVNDLYDPAV